MKFSKEMSSWLILVVVLVTAFITSWAMLKYKPSQDWNASYYPPQLVAQNFSPGATAMAGGWQFAAGTTAIPVVRAGAVASHVDRGVCTNCHTMVSSRQQPIPAISANATMSHEYRGVCTNCHRLTIQGGVSTTNPPYTRAAAPMGAMAPVAPMVTPATATPARTAAEGEWMGMEVTPITPLTARQYGIPNGIPGLVVAEAEIPAATVGIRAGDVIVSVNAAPIGNMTDFFQATRNGTLTQGIVGIVRQGQRLSVNLARATTPAPATLPGTPLPSPPAGFGATMPAAQRTLPVAPVNAHAWGGGQGIDVAGRAGPAARWSTQF